MTPRPPSSTLWRALVAMSLLVALPASATDLVTFSRGALIIPEQATFQRGCGSLSAYGLVWRILQSNQPGGANASHPVTVYLAINDLKASPNRCVPTNRHTPPAPVNDTRWNDGCDFTITNTAEQPVVPVNYASTFPTTGIYPYGAIDNFTTTADTARPFFTAATLNNTVTSPRFSTVRYMGGAFIIDAADAKYVIDFIRSGTGDLSPEKFRTTCANDCSTFKNNSGCHHVRMHQSTIEFTAPVARRINRVPPKIALLDLSDGTNSDGDPLVKGGMLDDYLRNAGLDFPGAGGCPEGTTSGCTLNSKKPGLIYDALHANVDLISTASFTKGLINAVDPVTQKPRYKVFWAPHWEIGNIPRTEYVANGDGATTQRENALNNIAHFTNQRGNGLFAECASIWSYETTKRPDNTPVLSSRFQGASGFQYNKLSGGNDWDGRNCTDPDYMAQSLSNRKACILYPNAGDPFSQMGDFRFKSVVGHTENYRVTYKDGVRRLAVSWYGHKDEHVFDNAAQVAEDNRRGHDFFSFNQKDNDPKKATIVYLAGHDFKSSVPGTRIVLNTLLNLGSEPLSSERALSAPVAFDDTNGSDSDGSRALVFAATYDAVSGYPPGVDTYVHAQGSQWVFPYFPGHLRAHSLIGGDALATGESNLDSSALWDADTALPRPGERNLFTYFGGQVRTNPSLGAGLRAPRGVLQVGWKPQNVDGTDINANYGTAPNSGCVDVLKLGEAQNPDGTSRFDFITTPTGDGVCDLQQAVQYSPQLPGTDFGQSTEAVNKAKHTADFDAVAQLLQRVRGFCIATSSGHDASGTPILEPSDSQCNNDEADNRAHLGGFVHSAPAVVKASANIPDQGAPRPTVAYAAGLDGQLHAFYVSGGAGYDGPAEALSFPNVSPAASAFPKNWSQSFLGGATPARGTELWSFLPATQIPWLRSNNARVNSAPVVMDVFADFVGSGKREWHTVLVANVGNPGRDLFAMDITNPLRPVLLWHLVGSHAQTGAVPAFAPVELADRDTGGTQWAVKWKEKDARFLMAPQADPGREPSGLYNYGGLGGTRGLSVGVVRQGLEPVYAVFVASSSSGASGAPAFGMEVFAIDAATGQKLWQWEQDYTQSWVDNTSPTAPTVLTDTGGASRLYVGDMEGRLWELDGATGQNSNVLRLGPSCSETSPCKYSALDTDSTDTERRPITTNVALARLPQDITTGTALKGYEGELIAMVGTGGVDWVQPGAAGQVHLAMLDRKRRLPMGVDGFKLNNAPITASSAHTLAENQGVLQEPAPFPLSFAGPRHIYGNITVAGRTAYFSTANGKLGDLMALDGMMSGNTWKLDLGNTATSASAAATNLSGLNLANFGGVTVYHRENGASSQDYVVGLEVSRITNTRIDNSGAKGPSSPNEELRVNGQGGFIFRLLNWSQRFFE
ncbi:hypothetical protein FJV41_12550 [Myxococcus llanfairpwllgwyngyllgogerychwyrndrobwllllantysiliogogogochensis]|uniref:PilC beta-propeller domain-containing protein n=1 Tax=Myxococcus llanfairpwllgwyngyllgogerychwyrndrobwllllantysiliogogogochensis TaxID=2590453 RepID=A0A540X2Z4_9BACT|nr:hypothetical protein [Myxococcus llanfairpwllgwyngyllgogerychwyrndrobwllllantysiliogogogochensis]TQF15617.1 hypothetical protein FJV41_12550 [Myxococcus llanfairpwllgwyngyllgogerychwyrndrobwllllantysiliogogogochensis]